MLEAVKAGVLFFWPNKGCDQDFFTAAEADLWDFSTTAEIGFCCYWRVGAEFCDIWPYCQRDITIAVLDSAVETSSLAH